MRFVTEIILTHYTKYVFIAPKPCPIYPRYVPILELPVSFTSDQTSNLTNSAMFDIAGAAAAALNNNMVPFGRTNNMQGASTTPNNQLQINLQPPQVAQPPTAPHTTDFTTPNSTNGVSDIDKEYSALLSAELNKLRNNNRYCDVEIVSQSSGTVCLVSDLLYRLVSPRFFIPGFPGLGFCR